MLEVSDTDTLCCESGEYVTLCMITPSLTSYTCPECASILNIKDLVRKA